MRSVRMRVRDSLHVLVIFGRDRCKMEAKSRQHTDRKKIDSGRQMSDVAFVTQAFRKEFAFESNVNVVVTFQRFDPEWGEHIDLDPDSELQHKDKLVAVVTPILVTPPASSTAEQSLAEVSYSNKPPSPLVICWAL